MVKIKDFTLASKNLGGRAPVPYTSPAYDYCTTHCKSCLGALVRILER